MISFSLDELKAKMLRVGLLLVCIALVEADRFDVTVGDQWTIVVKKAFYRSNNTWAISTNPGSTIKVYCEDFRLPIVPEGDDCDYTKVIFDDGVKEEVKCSTQRDFQHFGQTSKMVIDFITEHSGGYVYCRAKAVHPPKSYENIDITLGNGIEKINFPEVLRQEHDKAWRFSSTTGHKISLQCENRMERRTSKGECILDILTVDAGNGPNKTCGYDKVVAISKGTEITMRLETFPETEAKIECLIQAVTGPDPNEINNVKFTEEDSSEYGVSPGRKSTTCPCGMANRDSGGRIINGTEVKNEGKFPFMVSLRSTGDGHFCGASIITPLHILTAAHCVSDRWTKNQPSPSELMPTIGAHALSQDAAHGDTQRLVVKQVVIPQEWFAVKGSLAGDIAILVLESPIKFTKWVSPVCLTSKQPQIINKLIKAMGWGQTEYGYPDKLREASVHVLDKAMCNNDPRETCFRSAKTSTCFGDSGGPYVHVDPETNRYTQVALVSYGLGKCEGPYFVGTNTVYWYDWIQSTVAATSGGNRICRKIE